MFHLALRRRPVAAAIVWSVMLLHGRAAQTPSSAGPVVGSEGPYVVSDIAVAVDAAGGATAYLVDSRDKTLYVRQLPPGETRTVRFAEFRAVRLAGLELIEPTAIAARGKFVIVADAGRRAIFEVDPSTGRWRQLARESRLERPSDITIEPGGHITVADSSARKVLSIRTPDGSVRVYETPGVTPDRIAVSRSELVVLDERSKMLAMMPLDSGRVRSTFNVGRMSAEPHLEGLASVDGIHYVTDSRKLLVSDGTDNFSLPAQFTESAEMRPSAVAAAADHLFVVDGVNRLVWVLKRPLPALVVVEQERSTAATSRARPMHPASYAEASRRATQSVVAVYEYLLASGTLPTKIVTAGQALGTVEEWLVRERVLLAPLSASATSKPASRFVAVLTALNPNLGESSAPQVLKRPVVTGFSLTIPALAIEETLRPVPVSLGPSTTVDDYLWRSVSRTQREFVDSDYLATINRVDSSRLRTLETELNLGGFLLATRAGASSEWKPGSLVRFGPEHDIVVGHLSDRCPEAPTSAATEELYLRKGLSSAAGGSYVPRGVTRAAQFSSDVVGVQFHYHGLNTQTLPKDFFSELRTNTALTGCLGRELPKDVHVVVETIAAHQVDYGLITRDGSVRPPNPQEASTNNLLGAPSADGWTFRADAPVAVAYKLASVEALRGAGSGKTLEMVDVRNKPASSQNVYAWSGELTLPVPRWTVKVLVAATDARALRQIEAADSWLTVHSTGPLATTAKAIPSESIPLFEPERAESGMLRSFLADQRQALLEAIDYIPPPTRRGLKPTWIGIVEDAAAVDQYHPGFSDSYRSAWLKLADRDRAQECDEELLPAASAQADTANPSHLWASIGVVPSPRVKRFAESDHGSHVAGLIGARDASWLPGLFPGAELHLINSKNNANLADDFSKAGCLGVDVYNISLGFPHDAVANLQAYIENARSLFVAAAGNEDVPVSDRAEAPISWAEKFANVIGVGGATRDGQYLLGDWLDDDRKRHLGSNHGFRHVHLVAPAYRVFSLASQGEYAQATGSSQAAPQVTAAAAMVMAQGYRDPAVVKARLIATADWYKQFQNHVLGGLLNVKRAVEHPDRTFVTFDPKDPPYSVSLNANPTLTVRVSRTTLVSPPQFQPPASMSVHLWNVLRISRLSNKKFRIVFVSHSPAGKEDPQLVVMTGVDIDGKISCSELEQRRPDGAFVRAAMPSVCPGEINITSVEDYVAEIGRIPAKLRF